MLSKQSVAWERKKNKFSCCWYNEIKLCVKQTCCGLSLHLSWFNNGAASSHRCQPTPIWKQPGIILTYIQAIIQPERWGEAAASRIWDWPSLSTLIIQPALFLPALKIFCNWLVFVDILRCQFQFHVLFKSSRIPRSG